MVCECQWGLTGMIFGFLIVCAAGVFAVIPYIPVIFGANDCWFDVEWYTILCWAWFILGAAILSFGCIWEICGCQPQGRWAKSREEISDDGLASAPTPYIMIA